MARPKVDQRLQNIESGISRIMDKLCEISPCDTKDDAIVDKEEQEK